MRGKVQKYFSIKGQQGRDGVPVKRGLEIVAHGDFQGARIALVNVGAVAFYA